MHAQLSSAQQYIAPQRSAPPCGAVPCPALLCCVVLRCDFFRTYSSTEHETKYQVPGTGRVYVLCTRLMLFLQLISFGPHIFSPAQHPYCRSECDTANKHTTHHSTTQSNLLRTTSSSWHDQFGVSTKSCASSFCPLFSCFSCILPCASVAGCISRPRSGALVSPTKQVDARRPNLRKGHGEHQYVDICQRCVKWDTVYTLGCPGIKPEVLGHTRYWHLGTYPDTCRWYQVY